MQTDFNPRKGFEYMSILSLIAHKAIEANSGEFVYDLKKSLYDLRWICPEEILAGARWQSKKMERLNNCEDVRQRKENFQNWFVKPYAKKFISLESLYKKKFHFLPRVENGNLEDYIQHMSTRDFSPEFSNEQIVCITSLFVIGSRNGLARFFLGEAPSSFEEFFFLSKVDGRQVAVSVTCEDNISKSAPDFIFEAQEIIEPHFCLFDGFPCIIKELQD